VGCGRSARSWTEEGDRLLRSNELVEAELAYSRALEKDPSFVPAIYGKGWALYAAGYDSLAEPSRQLFQRAIDYDPEYYGGYRGMGVLLLKEGKVPAAERYLRQAFELAPQEPTVLESLGQLYLEADRLEEASNLFEAAVQLAPNRGELRRFLADVALRRGDEEGALLQIQLGRDSAVSGQRGLILLDEGEVMIFLYRARRLMRASGDSRSPALDEALQALDRADTVMDEAARRGAEAEMMELRRLRYEPLERRLRELSAESPPGGAEAPSKL